MKNQLSNISTQYRKFSKGQYIEYTHFNEFLDFFEDQDRLSRVMLQGVGIVCGFKPDLIYTSGQLSGIQLSQGVALTTDGDLLTLNTTSEVSKDLYVSDLKTIKIDNKKYTHFKAYDNFKVKYPAFNDGNNGQIELWELATTQEASTDFQTVNNLSDLEDKYLLLYLESYEKEVKPCRGVDCDNHGVQQIRNLKVLVTTAEGINILLRGDKIQPHPLFIDDILTPVKQERVIVERLFLNSRIGPYYNSSDLQRLYSSALAKNGYGQAVFEKISAISQVIGVPVYDYQPFKRGLESYLNQIIGFQYAYDIVTDLTDTYSEIIKLLPKAFTKCFPDLVSFPKHILLGKLISNTQLDSSRHRFYNSPVLDDEKAMQKIKTLINRFNLQVQNIRYPNNAQIKITPSQKLNPLSNKAIPFYYQITEEFLKAWNFDKTSNRASKDNLGYDTSLLSSDAHIQNPLNFNIDKNSFYNIEGHQGMDYLEAFEQIKKIRDEKQLGFDIMLLSFDELVNNNDMFKAYFNEYVDKHPGLEHKRGVAQRGTFIMVYDSFGRDGIKVVADFSLPYICCTPKVDVKLTLPTSVICTNASHIPFTVFPMNGVVKANTDLDAGVELIDRQYFFNPALVAPELYDEEITFTVNGKPTSCSIRVTKQKDVKINIVDIVYPTDGSAATTVYFKVQEADRNDYTYSWDFWGNGNPVNLKPDGEGRFTYTFRDLNPKIIPTIKVSVSKNGCTQNIEFSDWYLDEGPSTVITGVYFTDSNCCEGTVSVPVITAGVKGPDRVNTSEKLFKLEGEGTSSGTSKFIYSWAKIKGPAVKLTGTNKSTLEVTNLVAGEYVFELTVLDVSSGEFAKSKEFVVTVYSEDK